MSFEYLGRFNFHRSHQGLDFQPPVQRFATSLPCESQKIWHHTLFERYKGIIAIND